MDSSPVNYNREDNNIILGDIYIKSNHQNYLIIIDIQGKFGIAKEYIEKKCI